MENRLKWAQEHQETEWDKVIFTDESTFYLHTKRLKTWSFPWKKKVFRSVKHPAKVNVWGCFSSKGFRSIYCFTNNLTAKSLCTIQY